MNAKYHNVPQHKRHEYSGETAGRSWNSTLALCTRVADCVGCSKPSINCKMSENINTKR